MKVLPITVYRTNRYSDCTNGGISSQYDTLLLVCDDGYAEVDDNDLPENLVVMVTRNLFGKEYKHIEPYARTNSNSVGWMAGGNIAYSCDSRFRMMSEYPLSIHDRQETQEQYDITFN